MKKEEEEVRRKQRERAIAETIMLRRQEEARKRIPKAPPPPPVSEMIEEDDLFGVEDDGDFESVVMDIGMHTVKVCVLTVLIQKTSFPITSTLDTVHESSSLAWMGPNLASLT